MFLSSYTKLKKYECSDKLSTLIAIRLSAKIVYNANIMLKKRFSDTLLHIIRTLLKAAGLEEVFRSCVKNHPTHRHEARMVLLRLLDAHTTCTAHTALHTPRLSSVHRYAFRY